FDSGDIWTTANIPVIINPTFTNSTATGAIFGGDVTSDGGSAIVARGVVYSVTATNSNPQIGGAGVTKIAVSGRTGVFTASVSGLAPGTSYCFAAYATNGVGTTYTLPVSTYVTPFLVTPSAGAHGTITPNKAQNIAKGGSVSFTTTPAVGY